MNLLVINGTYTNIELALVRNRHIVAQTSIAHIYASTQLIPALQKLISETGIELTTLSACAVNIGPGPFTTMRSIIATINGVAYAAHLPLIAINGIETFAQTYKLPEYTHTCILLNAFCNDVYYAQYDYATETIRSGCVSIGAWIEEQQKFLQQYPLTRVAYAGNGCTKYQHELATAFGMHAMLFNELPEVPSLQAMVQAACAAGDSKENFVSQLTPLYFKAYTPHK